MKQNEIIQNFVEESQEYLMNIEPDLLEMEKAGAEADTEAINRVFRAIHSIKGASAFFGFRKIGQLSHIMENLLSLIREKKLIPESEIIDALFAGTDALKAMIDDITSSETINIDNEMQLLQRLLKAHENEFALTKISEKEGDNTGACRSFDINESQLRQVALNGAFLYCLSILWHHDIESRNVTLQQFFEKLEETGQIIDIAVDVDAVPNLDEEVPDDLVFNLLYASILEHDLISVALEFPEERVNLIEREKYKKGIHSSEKSVSEKPECRMTINSEPEKQDDPQPNKKIQQIQTDEKIRVSVNLLNDLVNLAGELVLGRNQLSRIVHPLIKETNGLNQIVQHISHITTEMQEKIMQMRMQPVSNLFDKFQRIIRDLAKQVNKEIRLVTNENNVELDKTIIELLDAPLTHLIRNCVDHGFEMPDAREQSGKSRIGTVELKAYHQAGQVNIEIIDDGKGIDGKKIGQTALKKGIVSAEVVDAMTEKELINLIFRPGFSTTEQVTTISGRGVGMDVVKTNIEQLGGSIEVTTKVGLGTSIRLILPLTLAIVSGLVIQSAAQTFILPEVNIKELVRVKPDEVAARIKNVNNAHLFELRGDLIPLIYLDKLLKLNPAEKETSRTDEEPVRVLIVRHEAHNIGIIVDSLENIEEIVVKPLPRYMKKMKCYSGASIMGNGTVALILDVAGLVEKADLRFTSQYERKDDSKSEDKTLKEVQTFLLFDNDTDERFALPLELITRIERVDINTIERISDKQYLQYQGAKLRLIFLEDYLPVNRPERHPDDAVGVIIPKNVKNPMGIIIKRVIGTIQAQVDLDTETIIAPGLFGSAVLDDRITLIPDMFALFEMADPELSAMKKRNRIEQEKKRTILLVDDTPFFRMIESQYLNSAGYDVVQAENGKKALSALEEQQVDAVILDIIMPEMDGWDCIQAIRTQDRWKDLPVIAVTALGDKKAEQKGLEAGFTAWEGKLNKERLLEKLNTILQ